MARIPYVDGADAPADLVARISAGRRGSLINVYRLLLHSAPLAATWFAHLNAVRWRTGLPGRLRELVIIRVAMLNRTDYVLGQHVPSSPRPTASARPNAKRCATGRLRPRSAKPSARRSPMRTP